MKTIVIDPGHGGKDPGAVAGGFREADIALAYAKMLGHFLRAMGYKTSFTREEDKTLSIKFRQERVGPGEILVSCHCNAAANPYANGCEVWYRGGIEQAKRLAGEVITKISAAGLVRIRGIYPDSSRYAIGFYMLRHAEQRGCRECILVEPGFLSHSGDRAILTNEKKRNLIAKAIAEGIHAYISSI